MANHRALSRMQRDSAIAEYLEGRSAEAVGKRFGVSANTIIREVGRGDNPIRSRSDYRLGKLWPVKEAIRAAYLSGQSSCRLAKRYKVSKVAILSLLRRIDVERRQGTDSMRRHRINEAAFDTVSPESSYWAGFIMADGCICQDKRHGSPCLVVAVSRIDMRHIYTLRRFLESTHKVVSVTPKSNVDGYLSKPSVRLTVSSRRLVAALGRFGVRPRKSLRAKAAGGMEENRDFWRGVIDGDGTVSIARTPSGKYVYWRPHIGLVGSKPLLLQFAAFVARRTGISLAVRKADTIWQCRCVGEKAVHIIRLLYSDCSVALPRKLAKARTILAPPRPITPSA